MSVLAENSRQWLEYAPSFRQAPEWITELRQAGQKAFAQQGMPTRRNEAWRYTSLAPLDKHALPAAKSVSTQVELQPIDGFEGIDLLVIDGRPLLTPVHEGLGIEILELNQAVSESPDKVRQVLNQVALSADDYPLGALNLAWLANGVWIHVPEHVQVAQSLRLVYLSTQADCMVAPRTLICLEPAATITVVQHYQGAIDDTAAAAFNGVTEVALAAGARLNHVVVQEQTAKTWHIDAVHVQQQAASYYSLDKYDLGARLARSDVRVVLAGAEAECRMNGLYVAATRQHIDNHTLIDHAVADCESYEYFKGVMDGHAKAVFDGGVLVRKDAQRINSEQQNRNLLLSRQAEVATKPGLEIYADDVKCAHGTTVGELDETALFYLASRGMDEATAKGLLTWAFAAEQVVACVEPAIARYIANAVAQKLPGNIEAELPDV